VYIGTDVKTGKRITKTITAKTLKSLDKNGAKLRIFSQSVQSENNFSYAGSESRRRKRSF
ncbi:MAG: hypothetical protein ACFNP8_07860, partial [Alloprevotella sp.]